MVKIKNKKAMELSLNTIIIFIILIIVFILVVYFFVQGYTSEGSNLINVGNSAINSTRLGN